MHIHMHVTGCTKYVHVHVHTLYPSIEPPPKLVPSRTGNAGSKPQSCVTLCGTRQKYTRIRNRSLEGPSHGSWRLANGIQCPRAGAHTPSVIYFSNFSQ